MAHAHPPSPLPGLCADLEGRPSTALGSVSASQGSSSAGICLAGFLLGAWLAGLFSQVCCEMTYVRFSFTYYQVLCKLHAIFPLNLLATNVCRLNWGHLVANLKFHNNFSHLQCPKGGGPQGEAMSQLIQPADYWRGSCSVLGIGSWLR